MTQHIMTNGIQITGTTGNVQLASEIAGRVLCVDVRHRIDVVGKHSGKRLPVAAPVSHRLRSLTRNSGELYSMSDRITGRPESLGQLPATAWAMFIVSRHVPVVTLPSSVSI